MKSRNKVFSILIALVLAIGIIALPLKAVGETYAAETTTAVVSTADLTVLKVDKDYDTTNNKLTYSDYCTTQGAEVVVWSPNGSLARGNWHTFDGDDVCTFTRPGVYAMQFRLKSNDIYTYSDTIYVPVSDKIADITFESDLRSEVKPGTEVTIPKATEQSVNVKVYTPYGQEVIVTNNKFTNLPNILGTYYIEYSLNVIYDGVPTSKLVYKTIEFSLNSNVTNATIENIEKEEAESNDYRLVVSGTELGKEKDYIYLYKYYDLTTAYVLNPEGERLDDATIFVTVFDDTDKKYYNFDTEEFETSTSNERKKDIKSLSSDFILRTTDNLSSMSATGHAIKVTYTCTHAGKNLEQVLDRTEKFNFEAITAKTKKLSPSEVTDIIVKESVSEEDFNLGVIELSGVELCFEDGYDEVGLKALIKSVNFAATNSLTGKAHTSASATPREENEEGIDIVDNGGLLVNEYKLYYNTYATKEFYFVMAYSINFESATDSDFSGTKRIEFRTYAREESKDTIKPYDLTIESYSNVITGTSWVVPTLTSSDKDNDGNTTTGANVRVFIKGTGSRYSSETEVGMGEELMYLTAGVYTVRYEATDYVGNTRTKTIHFEVKDDDSVNSCPSLIMENMEITTDEDVIFINGITNAEYVIVYTSSDSFSPKTTYANGTVNKVEFNKVLDEHGVAKNCVAVFAKSNAYGTVYRAVQVNACLNDVKATSIGYTGASSSYTEIVPNSTMKVKVLDKLIWFGNEEFTIECGSENGKYIVTDDNEITFLTSGTYIVTSTETIDGNDYETETTITVSETISGFSIDFPVGQQEVAKKGDVVEISYPYVANYYGYTLEIFVTNSKGNVVATIGKFDNAEFTASKTDQYFINYKFTAPTLSSKTSVVKVSTGNTSSPTISILGVNENVVWTGETIRYELSGASSVDKNGTLLDVRVYVYDANGNAVAVKTDGNTKYVEVKDAGIYTIYYASVDGDGIEAISKASFAVEFPEEEEEAKISAWGIVGIVLGSLVCAGLVAFCVIIIIRKQKSKSRFINKTKQVKKQEKQEREKSQVIITITEGRDEKHWVIKKAGRQIGKEGNKIDAIKKAKELDAGGTAIIKVYNKNGRLIDSL